MRQSRYYISRAKDILEEQGIKSLIHSGVRFVETYTVDSEIYYWNKYRIRQRIESLRHGDVPHPLTIMRVSPENIKYVSGNDPNNKWSSAGKVKGGSWDKNLKRFKELDIYKAFEARFIDGVEWENTDYYQRVTAEIANGKTKWGCSSEAEFKDRCRKLDSLYESIAEEGYMSRIELKEKESIANTDSHTLTSNSVLRYYDEIAVDIGRDGELLFLDGRNRLSIAKIIGCEEVPVRIIVRHRKWQKRKQSNQNETV